MTIKSEWRQHWFFHPFVKHDPGLFSLKTENRWAAVYYHRDGDLTWDFQDFGSAEEAASRANYLNALQTMNQSIDLKGI